MRADRWFALLTMTRPLGAAVAVLLLVAHRVTASDLPLAAVTVVWTALTLAVLGRSARLRASPLAWTVDTLAALGLVLASGDWRSPFYVFALTTLVLPATALPWRAAAAWGVGFSCVYGLVALGTEQLPSDTLGNTIRMETLATHLLVPIVVTMLLAYSSALLIRLRDAREESERLSLQAERQRIAWELHDSAKQRVHAAHLMLSALAQRSHDGEERELVQQALRELRATTADMEASVAELRAPLDGRPVDELLRERAGELAVAAQARIDVRGHIGPLPPLIATHAYRIAAEALTNAVRHADCSTITVTLSSDPAGGELIVADDGIGLPAVPRLAGHGLRSMRGRAETIGARLEIGSGPHGRGTRVALALPEPRGAP